jgi:hypothetical protein
MVSMHPKEQSNVFILLHVFSFIGGLILYWTPYNSLLMPPTTVARGQWKWYKQPLHRGSAGVRIRILINVTGWPSTRKFLRPLRVIFPQSLPIPHILGWWERSNVESKFCPIVLKERTLFKHQCLDFPLRERRRANGLDTGRTGGYLNRIIIQIRRSAIQFQISRSQVHRKRQNLDFEKFTTMWKRNASQWTAIERWFVNPT